MALFGRKRGREGPAEVYEGLRAQALRLTPDQLGDAVSDERPVLALLMETGYPEAVATLLAVADGTTSLYFSNGGGIIGAGEHPSVAEGSRRWLDAAAEFLPALAPTTDPPPPEVGATQFVAVTREGLRADTAPEDELGAGRHKLSPLFHGGQDVITQIRLVEEGGGA